MIGLLRKLRRCICAPCLILALLAVALWTFLCRPHYHHITIDNRTINPLNPWIKTFIQTKVYTKNKECLCKVKTGAPGRKW